MSKGLSEHGEILALWLGDVCSAANAKSIAKDIGYNDNPFFGARRRKAKLASELVFVNTALAIFAVNQVFEPALAKPVIDQFLATARKNIFNVLEKEFSEFAELYPTRMKQYFETLTAEQPLVGVSFGLLQNLGVDPLGNLNGQLIVAGRLRGFVKQALVLLQIQAQSVAPRPPAKLTTEAGKEAELAAFGSFMQAATGWNDPVAFCLAMTIVNAAMEGRGPEVEGDLANLTVSQMRDVMDFLRVLDHAPSSAEEV